MEQELTKIFKRIAPKVYKETPLLLLAILTSFIVLYPNFRETLFSTKLSLNGFMITIFLLASWFLLRRSSISSLSATILVLLRTILHTSINAATIWLLLTSKVEGDFLLLPWLISLLGIVSETATIIFLLGQTTVSVYIEENYIDNKPILSIIVFKLAMAFLIPGIGANLLHYSFFINAAFSLFFIATIENIIHSRITIQN